MGAEDKVLRAAAAVTQALNRVADETLPERLAEIVKLHAGLAVGSALIPVPGADLAAGTANIWAMYVRINKELHLPFKENALKSIAAGVATNIAGNLAGVPFLVVGSLLKVVPGVGTLAGMALEGLTLYGITMAAGYVYMQALARLAGVKPPEHLTEEDLKRATAEVAQDKDAIHAVVQEAKKSYKEAKADEAAMATA